MLVATNVVITSEWSSIVYNTQMTDVTGLENGSFSLRIRYRGCRCVSKLLPVRDVLAVLAVQTAKPAAKA